MRVPVRLSETLAEVLRSFSMDLHVALPGTVRSYDASKQTADIELGVRRVVPALNEEDEEDQFEDLPILPSVPIVWPRAGGFYVHWPMAEGDQVWVSFGEADLTAWRESGGVADPGVDLRHGLSGAVAHPGAFSLGRALSDASGTHGRIGKDGGAHIEFREAEIRAGGSEALALATAVSNELTAIKATLNSLTGGSGSPAEFTVAYTGPGDLGTDVLKGS